MAGQTVQYKRTIKGSVGAGMGALFNGSGRQFYILQHKDTSKYHHAGESQKIIIDQIELGRAKDCQIRFDDEAWPIVSRKHAAIVKDQTGWKIVPLSQTNSTLVNGKVINTEWYLQNGDEIQLSIGGPRLGFIVPAGAQSLVSSIKLTERLNLFRDQALKPYKTAIAVLCSVLVVACGVGGYFLWEANEKIKMMDETRSALIKNIEEQRIKDSIERARLAEEAVAAKKEAEDAKRRLMYNEILASRIEEAKKDVYAVMTTVEIKLDDEVYTSQSIGTGFLLSDGRFVTARHCVQPWMYDTGVLMKSYALSHKYNDVKVTVTIDAVNSSYDSFTLSSEDFVVDSSRDVSFSFYIGEEKLTGYSAAPLVDDEGTKLGDDKMYSSDWAYAKVNRKGSLTIDANLSQNLKSSQKVHVLGFPGGLGVLDGEVELIEPIYNDMNVSRDGLNASGCIMVSQGVAKGNSGGPVFAYVDGKLKVVAIVSRKETATQAAGDFGIQLQQQQYDQLVPIANLK